MKIRITRSVTGLVDLDKTLEFTDYSEIHKELSNAVQGCMSYDYHPKHNAKYCQLALNVQELIKDGATVTATVESNNITLSVEVE